MAGIGHRIKNLRLSLGLSQSEFAEKVHTSQPLLSYIENERVAPGIELIIQIVSEYGSKGITYESLLEPQGKKQTKATAHIGRNIRKLMQEEGFDAEQLAQQCQLLSYRVKEIASGQVIPTLEEILGILRRFDKYNVNWILFDKGAMLKANEADQAAAFALLKDELMQSMHKNVEKKGKFTGRNK